MSVDLDRSVVLLTGAAGGLGTGLALEFASRGARLALMGRRPEPLEALADRVGAGGTPAIAVPGDVTDAGDRARVVAETEERLGPIDVLVNNAGIAKAVSFLEEDPELVLGINLVGAVALTRRVVTGMVERGRGQVLTVSSLGMVGLPHLVNYSASKAGLRAFSTALREELVGTGVSTTLVIPGFMGDSGIYLYYRTPVPWYVGSNSTDAIARKAVDALVADKGEAVLNQLPVRPLLVLKSASESLFRALVRTLGLNRYMASVANERVDYDGTMPPDGPA